MVQCRSMETFTQSNRNGTGTFPRSLLSSRHSEQNPKIIDLQVFVPGSYVTAIGMQILTIMMDESVDVYKKEQLVTCSEWVDSSLVAHEDFVGPYHLECTQAFVIVTIVCDVLQRLNISITKLEGRYYVGTSLHPCLGIE